ncbi:MAG: hypothetical protein RIC87_12905 [Kiloniellales bacterium]
MTRTNAESLSHQEAWDLLPWYVNGTLTPEEAASVEVLLQRHADLREELAAQRRLAKGVAALDVMDVEMESALGSLSQRLETSAVPPAADDRQGAGGSRSGGIGDLLRRFLSRLLAFDARVVLPMGAAAAALVLVVVLQPIDQKDQDFTTLTNPDAALSEGANLTVKAAAGADRAALDALFSAQGLRLVSGPSPKGVYALAAPEGDDPKAIAARLAESPLVDFSTAR